MCSFTVVRHVVGALEWWTRPTPAKSSPPLREITAPAPRLPPPPRPALPPPRPPRVVWTAAETSILVQAMGSYISGEQGGTVRPTSVPGRGRHFVGSPPSKFIRNRNILESVLFNFDFFSFLFCYLCHRHRHSVCFLYI